MMDFVTLLYARRTTLIPGTLLTLSLPEKSYPPA